MISFLMFRQTWRDLRPALRQNLLRPAVLFEALLAFGLSFGLTAALSWLLPPSTPLRPVNALVASFAVNLLLLGVLLARLPGRAQDCVAWTVLNAWLISLILSGAAFVGIAWAPGHHESLRTFFALWALFAAQAATIAATHSLLLLLSFGRSPVVIRQVIVLIVSVLVTALFWSKAIITMSPKSDWRESQTIDASPPDLADAVLKFSPPMAVASAWHQESDAARAGVSDDPKLAAQAEGCRFGLIHGPLTYSVWMGSYQAMQYPRILPTNARSRTEPFGSLGLALTMLLWSLPLLFMSELLRGSF
ncbi:MAG: hypothetical protein V1899_07195 [Planctomycetota bacterium]